MISKTEQSCQERELNFHCLLLPENFRVPRFKFGDLVATNEGDRGIIVGMTLARNDHEECWIYELDLSIDSPNFLRYQHEIYSYGCCAYNEAQLDFYLGEATSNFVT